MSKKLLIFPFGGNARESLVTIEDINKKKKEWDVIGFVDDDPLKWGMDFMDVKILGDKTVLEKHKDAYVLAVPGKPQDYLKRREIIEGLGIDESRFAKIIHPSAVISSSAKIGFNALIMPNVVVSCNVTVGNHCVILPNTTISHDSKIGDYCCIGSNVSISGNVRIKSLCYIASGTSIRDDITVDERTLVGIGSNVITNTEKDAIVAGNPAKQLKKTFT